MKAAGLSRRAGGLLLHPTSLPGAHGVGDLGPEARRFADFLAGAGLSWWQMLPIGPAGAGNSPYSSPSTFAGEPLLVSLERLVEWGLLDAEDLAAPADLPAGRVDYDAARAFKEPRLRKAFSRFSREGRGELWDGFRSFCRANSSWLDDFALFMALRENQRVESWLSWSPELRDRDYRRWRPELLKASGSAVAYHQFAQYLFDRQWQELKAHCAGLGIGLIGDVPIFVAHESADVWAHRPVFQLGEDGRPSVVAGVPPDYFSADGQLWGNPLYRWDVLKERAYDWWLWRLRTAARRFDAARLDHFIGFCRYWEIPGGAATAREGAWKPGPGADFLSAVRAEVPELELIAEDLGVVTPEVTSLRDAFALPGMRVLQFAFGSDDQAEGFLPHNYPRRCVAYTGTHDNDTTMGWFQDQGSGTRSPEAARREREAALRYLNSDGREFHWDMIAAAFRSTADSAIVPVQDVLGLGSEARMNRPGVEKGNWEWRLPSGALQPAHAERLRRICSESGRLSEVPA